MSRVSFDDYTGFLNDVWRRVEAVGKREEGRECI
jgi:hypothetical protein